MLLEPTRSRSYNLHNPSCLSSTNSSLNHHKILTKKEKEKAHLTRSWLCVSLSRLDLSKPITDFQATAKMPITRCLKIIKEGHLCLGVSQGY